MDEKQDPKWLEMRAKAQRWQVLAGLLLEAIDAEEVISKELQRAMTDQHDPVQFVEAQNLNEPDRSNRLADLIMHEGEFSIQISNLGEEYEYRHKLLHSRAYEFVLAVPMGIKIRVGERFVMSKGRDLQTGNPMCEAGDWPKADSAKG